MKSFVVALLVGLLFGTGLIVSGMSDPAKVLGFLDLAGLWDPSLAFVMGGAVMVGLAAFSFAANRPTSLLGDAMRLPAATQIDRRLVFGGLTFGVGWGLAGYCPGPALASLALGGMKPLLFCVAMFAGMALFELLEKVRANAGLSKRPEAP
ncbi:MAG: rane protein [Massilia sp.]|nr:rane protein [Massilia sp.]